MTMIIQCLKKINKLIFLILIPSLVQANSDLKPLLEVLKENETISSEQFEKIVDAVDNNDKNNLGIPAQINTKKNDEKELLIKIDNGLKISTYDGSANFSVGGRMMIDTAYYSDDKQPIGDGTEFRRARIEFNGKMYEVWSYQLDVEFGGGSADAKEVFLSYDGFTNKRIKIGQNKAPFSLEELTSSKHTTFMENALPNVFAIGRRVGILYESYQENWTFAAGFFGESFDNDVSKEGDESWGLSGRTTFTPVSEDTKVLHFGASLNYFDQEDNSEVRFRSRPESHVTDTRYLDTGKIKDVEKQYSYGLEFAAVLGPFSFQTEYINTHLERKIGGADDLDFFGYYMYGSWFITGESRAYKSKSGKFDRVKPLNEFGAIELALRYSMVDLTNGSVTGGETDQYTFGLNWYIKPNIKIMGNYVRVDNDINADEDGGVIGDDDPNIWQMRFQLDF